MTPQEFNNISKEKDIFYLYFYSPTCSTCEKIKPLLSSIKHPIHPIEGDKYREILDTFEVEYYPSLLEVKNNNITLYSGSKPIKNFIKDLEL